MKTSSLLLFDVDGTLTDPRQPITAEMHQCLQGIREEGSHLIAIVSGSDLEKLKEQLGQDVLDSYDFVFPENGLIAYHNSKLLESNSIIQLLGEEAYQRFVNFTLRLLSDTHLPIKRGTFIELRQSMINISPVGRNCSKEERNNFERWDNQHQCRRKIIEQLRREFSELKLSFRIGGQISFDVVPEGWDKTYCLKHLLRLLPRSASIHFFGDKCFPDGNDYELYNSPCVSGHMVTGPSDTRKQLDPLL